MVDAPINATEHKTPGSDKIEINTSERTGATLDATADFMASATALNLAEDAEKKAAYEKAVEAAMHEGYKKASVIYAMHGQDISFSDFKAAPEKYNSFVKEEQNKYDAYMAAHAKEIKKEADKNEQHGSSFVSARDDAMNAAAKKYYGDMLHGLAVTKADEFIARFDSLKNVPMSKISKDHETYKLLKSALGITADKNAEFGRMAGMSKITVGEFLHQDSTRTQIAANILKTPTLKTAAEAMGVVIAERAPAGSHSAPVSFRKNLKHAQGANTAQFNVIDGWKQQINHTRGFMDYMRVGTQGKTKIQPSSAAQELIAHADRKLNTPPQVKAEKVKKPSLLTRLWSKTKAAFASKPKADKPKTEPRAVVSKPSLGSRISAFFSRGKKKFKHSLVSIALSAEMERTSHETIIQRTRDREENLAKLKDELLNPNAVSGDKKTGKAEDKQRTNEVASQEQTSHRSRAHTVETMHDRNRSMVSKLRDRARIGRLF